MEVVKYVGVFFVALIGLYLVVRVLSFGVFQSWNQARRNFYEEYLKKNEAAQGIKNP